MSNLIFTFYLDQYVQVCTLIEELTGTKYISSNQHKSSSNSRAERDNTDIDKLIIFFKRYNPFFQYKIFIFLAGTFSIYPGFIRGVLRINCEKLENS